MVDPTGGGRGGRGRRGSGLSAVLSPLVEAEWSDMLEGLSPFFRERRYANGGMIFQRGALAHSLYFITSGEVTLWAPRRAADEHGPLDDDERADGSLHNPSDSHLGRRLVRYADGGIFGELDFFLRNPRSFSATASTPDTTVQVLTRDALQSMQSQAPQLAAALEHALLKYLSFQVNAKMGLSDGVRDVRD
jgi:CRP-like cAMP-binding protein